MVYTRQMSGDLTPFESAIDDAIRLGLRDGGVRGPLHTVTACVRQHVLVALSQTEPTEDEIVALIREKGGFMHLGDDIGFPDGRRAGPRALNRALLRLWREDSEELATRKLRTDVIYDKFTPASDS
jgi:hypothetical protein